MAQKRYWDGGAGDGQWNSAANWDGDILPSPVEDVIFDNSLLSGDYSVSLPVTAVNITVKSVSILPAGNRIEVLIPSTNTASPALTSNGPGYGLVIGAGGIFRNASGVTSGVTLQIADSISIRNNGRYIHQTKGAHALSIVRLLSTAAGTEAGIFEFDVPRASTTISLSGQTYGRLELSSVAYGGNVTYSANGSNPVHIRSDLVVNNNVVFSVSFSDTIFIHRNFIQAGGVFNIANNTSATVVAISGDFLQNAGTISESGSVIGELLLNGTAHQVIDCNGTITNSVAVTLDNGSGASLSHPLSLPFAFNLRKGKLTTSPTALLILQATCSLAADSLASLTFIDGPVKKEGLAADHFLFPVGRGLSQRWAELKNAQGDFTVEFFKASPRTLNTALGAGISHLSNIEYWAINANAGASGQAELSFDNVNSGGVTDLATLRAAQLQGLSWIDAGNSATTGTPGSKGSVTSQMLNNFNTGGFFTLASSVGNQNPLPQTNVRLTMIPLGEHIRLLWTLDVGISAEEFIVQASTDSISFSNVAYVNAFAGQREYQYDVLAQRVFYRIKTMLPGGHFIFSSIVRANHVPLSLRIERVISPMKSGTINIEITARAAGGIQLMIINSAGYTVSTLNTYLSGGKQWVSMPVNSLPYGVYHIFGVSSFSRTNTLRFSRN